MIAGYPLSLETGFLHQAVQHLHRAGEFKVAFDIVAMGGFPAHRACKHLAKKVLPQRPDVVVLQFGSTDASAPLRNNFLARQRSSKQPHGAEKGSRLPPTSRDVLKWGLRSFASELLLVPPIAPLKTYKAALLEMVDECRKAGSKVVVVSPFVMGGARSDRFARGYTRVLKESLPQTPKVHFLDAHALLSQSPRQQMLLWDGFHLSAGAHEKLGKALAKAIAETAREPS